MKNKNYTKKYDKRNNNFNIYNINCFNNWFSFFTKPLVNSFNNYKEKEDTYYKYLNSIYCVNEFKAAKEELFMKLVAFVLCLLLALFFLVITIDLASKL